MLSLRVRLEIRPRLHPSPPWVRRPSCNVQGTKTRFTYFALRENVLPICHVRRTYRIEIKDFLTYSSCLPKVAINFKWPKDGRGNFLGASRIDVGVVCLPDRRGMSTRAHPRSEQLSGISGSGLGQVSVLGRTLPESCTIRCLSLIVAAGAILSKVACIFGRSSESRAQPMIFLDFSRVGR